MIIDNFNSIYVWLKHLNEGDFYWIQIYCRKKDGNNVFNKNGKIGKINNLGARDNSYSVALGMLKYFNSKLLLRNREFSSLTEEEIDAMCTISEKNTSKNSLISRVVGYFFDD